MLKRYFIVGENTILVLTFQSHGQFSPYIFVAINLVHVILSLSSQFGPCRYLTNEKRLRGKQCTLLTHFNLMWQLK